MGQAGPIGAPLHISDSRSAVMVLVGIFIVGFIIMMIGILVSPKSMATVDREIDGYGEGTSLTISGKITDLGPSDGERGANYYTMDDKRSIYADTTLGRVGEEVTVSCKVKEDSDGEKYLGEASTSFFGDTFALTMIIIGALLMLSAGFVLIKSAARRIKK